MPDKRTRTPRLALVRMGRIGPTTQPARCQIRPRGLRRAAYGTLSLPSPHPDTPTRQGASAWSNSCARPEAATAVGAPHFSPVTLGEGSPSLAHWISAGRTDAGSTPLTLERFECGLRSFGTASVSSR